MGVPGVAVDHVGVDGVGDPVDRPLEHLHRRTELRRGRRGQFFRHAVALHAQPPLADVLVAEAADLDIDQACQFARQVLNMNTGATVDIRRILIGEEQGLHGTSEEM